MTKSEYQYLSAIRACGRADGTLCVSEIATRLGVSEVSVYKGMERLRKHGYVASDGRRATVTATGEKLLGEYVALISALARRLSAAYGASEEEAYADAVAIACAVSEKGRRVLLEKIRTDDEKYKTGEKICNVLR